MKAEDIEKMRINSRRNGLNPKSWYHAGAEDMQEAMVEKACKWIEENAGYKNIADDEVWEFNLADFRKAIED